MCGGSANSGGGSGGSGGSGDGYRNPDVPWDKYEMGSATGTGPGSRNQNPATDVDGLRRSMSDEMMNKPIGTGVDGKHGQEWVKITGIGPVAIKYGTGTGQYSRQDSHFVKYEDLIYNPQGVQENVLHNALIKNK